MLAYMPVRSFYRELRSVPFRKLAGLLALTGASLILAWRIDHLRNPPQLELGPRAEMLATIRSLGDRVLQYSEQYGRPVFMMIGVHHVSAAESTLYVNLRRDLADSRVRYSFGDEGFSIRWNDERWYPWSRGPQPIRQEYVWPKSASEYTHARWVAYSPPPWR
jgi:hypothetical protein